VSSDPAGASVAGVPGRNNPGARFLDVCRGKCSENLAESVMRSQIETYEDLDFAPTIADGERIRFDIRHVSGVQRLRRSARVRTILKHPVALVVIIWIVMAGLLILLLETPTWVMNPKTSS